MFTRNKFIRKIGNVWWVHFEGEVGAEDLLYIQSQLYGDPEYIKQPQSIFDFTKATISGGMVVALKVAMKTIMNRHFESSALLALVMGTDAHRQLALDFSKIICDLPIKIYLADSREDASRWIQNQNAP